ncbi:recombination regulator RecX [Butyrivibrio proteoclasticus B316]|uniref:Regulatory protein RecX n=1 Tax=Butyrivibrio proteoclasticus (strain ATCC 51982 / DSM 14932 / B316) TaxID=515622 RepID=E0RWK1_BUTPB|nr:regulatory protein RecX [Butyrivibrio proteoclasticus]ADL34375.1 recombination regulator RecX [Butyrivibrio proteoclasticus B316]
MTITDIVELDKKRCKIFIDGEFAFVLYKGELREYDIKSGNEISESVYESIKSEVLSKRAKLRAMNLLQKKDYTEKQLRDKLQEGLYSQELIDEAINYVKSYRYLDDERFARDYITYHMEMRSRNRILQDLTGKGISKDVTISIMDELYSESEEISGDIETEQINKLLIKKHFDKDMDYKDKQKIMGFLVRRGYTMDSIRRAMEEFE